MILTVLLILLRAIILIGILLYLFYETLYDHYILWVIAVLSWLLLPSKMKSIPDKPVDTQMLTTLLTKAMSGKAQADKFLLKDILMENVPAKISVSEKCMDLEPSSNMTDYLAELKHIQESGVQTDMLKELLDHEIVLCTRKLKHFDLRAEKKQTLDQLVGLQQLLQTTSHQVFREQLRTTLASLQGKIDQTTEEIEKTGLSEYEIREKLIECEDAIGGLINQLSPVSEDVEVTNSDEDEESASDAACSPWLQLCEGNTELDSHHSHLPTSAIERPSDWNWEQSGKFVKLYLDVSGLLVTDTKKVGLSGGERHASIFITDVGGRNYKFIAQDLGEAIDINQSKYRLREGRVVVFLKKRHQNKQWTELTARAAAIRRQSDERLLNKMRVVLTEFAGVTAMLEHLPAELRTRMLMESHCLIIDESASIAQLLELIQVGGPELPKFVLFKMRLDQSASDDDFESAMRALADQDSFVALQNAQFEHSPHVTVDDRFLQLLAGKPCELASFCGRLSVDNFPLLPGALLDLKLFISSAEELNALCALTLSLDTLHIRLKTNMDLRNVKNLKPFVLKTPMCLVFYGITDVHVDWLASALSKILPYTKMSGEDQRPEAWSLQLLECRMSYDAHEQLFKRLPNNSTLAAISIQDCSGSTHTAALATKYASLSCVFSIISKTPA